jgi:tetratricopeptide (TPR) repeat protein
MERRPNQVWRAVGAIAGLFLACASPAFADDTATCHSNTAPPDEAVAACSRVIASGRLTSEQLARILVSRGISHRQKNQLDTALADFDTAVRTDPRFLFALQQRGMTWLRKGNFAAAIADHDQALRIDPKRAASYFERGRAYFKADNKARASEDFARSISLDAKFASSVCYTNEASPEDGIRACTLRLSSADLSTTEKSKLHMNRAISWRSKGDFDKAFVDFNEAIRLDPKEPLNYTMRGAAWRARNDLQRAVEDFSEAIRVDPAYIDAYLRRGQAHESLGDRERALADYRAVVNFPASSGRENARETARTRIAALSEGPATPAPQSAAQPSAKQQPATQQTATQPPAVQQPAAQPPAAQQAVPRPPAGMPSVGEGRRVALVIGNAAYTVQKPLKNPANDAKVMGRALRGLGFEVLEGTDLTYTAMNKLIGEFLRKAATARVALFFFSGHGAQVDGRNYLMPTDAKLARRSTIAFEQVDLDRVLSGLDDENRTNIVILDACRSNLFEQTPSSTRAGDEIKEGLAAYSTVGAGMLIAFATAPGRTALDGRGENSPFTASLVKHITTPGLEVYSMLTRVRVDVASASQKKQVPWVNSSLMGEVYLAGKSQGSASR